METNEPVSTEPEVQNQAPASDQNGSEAGKTPESPEVQGMKAEMLRERNARQALEARMTDREFIYAQAKALGMTEEEAEAASAAEAPAPPARTPAAVQAPKPMTREEVTALMAAQQDYDRTVNKYPELLTDPDQNELLQTYVARGMRYGDAGEKVRSIFGRTATTAKATEEANQENQVAQKERASTASTTTTTTPEAETEATLWTNYRSGNSKLQEKALVELIKLGKL